MMLSHRCAGPFQLTYRGYIAALLHTGIDLELPVIMTVFETYETIPA